MDQDGNFYANNAALTGRVSSLVVLRRRAGLLWGKHPSDRWLAGGITRSSGHYKTGLQHLTGAWTACRSKVSSDAFWGLPKRSGCAVANMKRRYQAASHSALLGDVRSSTSSHSKRLAPSDLELLRTACSPDELRGLVAALRFAQANPQFDFSAPSRAPSWRRPTRRSTPFHARCCRPCPHCLTPRPTEGALVFQRPPARATPPVPDHAPPDPPSAPATPRNPAHKDRCRTKARTSARHRGAVAAPSTGHGLAPAQPPSRHTHPPSRTPARRAGTHAAGSPRRATRTSRPAP